MLGMRQVPHVSRVLPCGAQVTPLLAELRAGGLVANLEALTSSASDAAADIHRLQHEACVRA
jgi:hypothetical protein